MTRKTLTDGTARWIDVDDCDEYRSSDPNCFDVLYRTPEGTYVLERSVANPGEVITTRTVISLAEAAQWMDDDGYDPAACMGDDYFTLRLR